MDGEVRRHESDIKEYPENWEDMKQKYLDREEEKKKVVMARLKAADEPQLVELASKAIKTRAHRAGGEQKPFKDRTILREAKSEEIIDLKEKLEQEINAISQRIFSELPREAASAESEGKIILQGRITKTPPAT